MRALRGVRFTVWVGAEDHQQLSDVLNRRSARLAADFFEVLNPKRALVTIDTNLDQFVVRKGKVDFLENGSGEPVAGDGNDGVERMSASAKRASLGRREGKGHDRRQRQNRDST